MLFDRPDAFLSLLLQEGTGFLFETWQKLSTQVPSSERVQQSDFALKYVELEGRRAAIIGLPWARKPTEAFYIAIVEREPGSETDVRYLLLERTVDGDGVLCEWFGNLKRTNHQMLMEPEVLVFVKAVDDLLKSENASKSAGPE